LHDTEAPRRRDQTATLGNSEHEPVIIPIHGATLQFCNANLQDRLFGPEDNRLIFAGIRRRPAAH
jgi:hypothetical protein